MEAKLFYSRNQSLVSGKSQRAPRLSKVMDFILKNPAKTKDFATSLVLKKALTELPLAQCNNILDLDCNNGATAFMLASALKDTRVLATDMDYHATNKIFTHAKQMGVNNLDTFTGQIQELPHYMSFDLICNVDSIDDYDITSLPFAEYHSRLNKKGYLLMKLPTPAIETNTKQTLEEQMTQVSHKLKAEASTIKTFERRFIQEGFKVIAKVTADGFYTRLAWELSHLSKKSHILLRMITAPFCKTLILLDRQIQKYQKARNTTVLIIGQKI